MNDKKSYSYYVGYVLAALFITCIAICIGALCIAGTIKIISLIF